MLLPASINRELDGVIERRPVLRKLRPDLVDALRVVGTDAAIAALTGNVDSIVDKVLKGEIHS